MQDNFMNRGIKLIDFKLEFGKSGDEIILGDEITPDTCRLWDADSNKKLDKDRFRFDLGEVEDAYDTIYKKVMNIEDEDQPKEK
jgi:phosphoribosylaminoimidazole-succinocarboxamide synthase